jgi:hypothetical protein
MLFKKNRTITVQDISVSIIDVDGQDYICLTDMIKQKDGEFFVKDWLRNRNTLEFLSAWEELYNPDFNWGEFAPIKDKSGLNSFKISVKEWIEKTKAKGIIAKAGRYGGTYAHKDIALEFGMWISPAFKLYLIKEYQKLKSIENNQHTIDWHVNRVLTKTNYRLHTDAIKEYIVPKRLWRKELAYAEEAELLNAALFGCTSTEWRKQHPDRAKRKENIRDSASKNELNVLANLQSHNAEWVREGLDAKMRFEKMHDMAARQLKAFDAKDPIGSIKKESDDVYLPPKTHQKSPS